MDARPPRASLKHRLLSLAHGTGLLRAGRRLWGRSLTVLNYHRIDDPARPGFDSFLPNVSATPEAFDQQMEYLARWFHPVSLRDVVAWLDGGPALPPNAALISFDDGYFDNYSAAFPVLRKYKLPAVVFLTTGHIATDAAFYWDLAAYCFRHTGGDRLAFPDGHVESWADPVGRERVSRRWVESVKTLPDTEKQAAVQALPERLGVSVPAGTFRRLMMDWAQVREMHQAGVEFGAHTVNHPILTRIPLARAREEIQVSKSHIEAELGDRVAGFAYPNGQPPDWNPEIEAIVAGCGIPTAFTLVRGPASLREIRHNPFAIRRIFLSHRHSLADFALMLSPINRYRRS